MACAPSHREQRHASLHSPQPGHGGGGTALLTVGRCAAFAQSAGDWPTKPIRFVVNFGIAHWPDALIIAARADASNRQMINAEVLAALGGQGHLINISRGSIIDEPALIAALRSGDIAGAGLDVFADEPHVPETLRQLPTVVLSPHRAPGTVEAVSAMHGMVRANVDAFLHNGSVINPVPEMAAR